MPEMIAIEFTGIMYVRLLNKPYEFYNFTRYFAVF